MEALGPWHILIVAAVFVVLFGAKRLPDAARSLGRSARILKSELKDTVDSPATETVAAAEPVVPRQEPMVATVPPPPSSDPLNGNVGSRN